MRRILRKGKRVISAVLCAVLCAALMLSAAGCAGKEKSSGDAKGSSETAGSDEGADVQASWGSDDSIFDSAVPAEQKEESVYVKADPNGRPKKTTVEVVLKKAKGSDPIKDRSYLNEIKNTEGDEEYAAAGENLYVWQNHDEDIRYKGVSSEKLPVDVKVTYYLEGQEVTADQIAGKTGAVRIRFDYENRTDVPFMVLSSVMLPGEVFSDVEVENGKIMDFGDQKAVIGFAFPGLMDNLKLADYEVTEELDLPEFVEITARAESFELDFTATVVSTGLFDEIKDEDLKDFEDMSDDMDELTDASRELTDAADELADGGSEFGGYLEQYFDGIGKLSSGSSELDKGLQALSTNISQIADGSEALQEGLGQIGDALSLIDLSELTSEESKEQTKAVSEALQSLGQNTSLLGEKLSSVQTAVSGLSSYMEYLNSYKAQVEDLEKAVDENPAPVLSELSPDLAGNLNEEASAKANEGVQKVTQEAAEKANEEIQSVAEAAAEADKNSAQEAVESSDALDGLGLTEDQIAAAKEQLIGEIRDSIKQQDTSEVVLHPEEIEISLDELLAQTIAGMQEELDNRYGRITAAREQVGELELPDMSALSGEGTEEIKQIVEDMGTALSVVGGYAKGISSLSDSLAALSDGLDQLKCGTGQLTSGSKELTTGLKIFEDALDQAAEGSKQLDSALAAVSSAGGKLGSAYGQLVEGMDKFADGVAEFDEEGIQSLAELTGPEYMEVIRRVRAARDAEHGYNNFSGILDGQKGSVRFVIETEEISAD